MDRLPAAQPEPEEPSRVPRRRGTASAAPRQVHARRIWPKSNRCAASGHENHPLSLSHAVATAEICLTVTYSLVQIAPDVEPVSRVEVEQSPCFDLSKRLCQKHHAANRL